MKLLGILLLLVLTASCATSKNTISVNTKYAATELLEDLTVLKTTLEKNHPGLYWYTPKDSIDYYFGVVRNSISDSMTEASFKTKLAWLVSKIRCGHTVVRSSKKVAKAYRRVKTPQFPLSLKVWRDSAVVIENRLEDSVIRKGTVIKGIKGLPFATVTDSIGAFISSDGYNNTLKYQLMSFNFPGYFKMAFGADTTYTVDYLDSDGALTTTTLPAFSEKNADSTLPGKNYKQIKITKSVYRRLNIDTNRTAYLTVNTFSKGNLHHFFKKSFRQLKKQQVKNLVVDLRMNSGGNVSASTYLLRHLVCQPFKLADTVVAVNRSLKNKHTLKPWFIYWLSMQLNSRKQDDGKYHFGYFEKHSYKPVAAHRFMGNIYVLTSGYTFSAAAMVAEKLKGQPNVTIVGDETGGAAYGNNSMHITNIRLPHSGINVSLPLFRIVNSNEQKNGRGVLPDIRVSPTAANIIANTDAKKQTVDTLISK